MRAAVSCIGLILYLCLGAARSDYDDDSLQAAINAVSQRRRMMAMAQARDQYETDDRGPQSDSLPYLDFPNGDVRLEGPGYNYQMLLSQIRGPNPYSKDDFEPQSDRSRSLEEALSEYINNVSPDDASEMKRSAFRELAEQPDALQRLGGRNGDASTAGFLTSFRERAKPANYEEETRLRLGHDGSRSRNEEAEQEYLEEYFDALNDAVNTYLQNSIPVDLQKNYKDNVKKRQYDNYDTGYDFFNSPLQGWSKRDKSRSKNYAYGLSFYDDEGTHPRKSHLERAPKPPGGLGHHIMRKRLWRDGSVDKGPHSKANQRFMLKRSSKTPHAYSSNARLVRSKKDSHKLSMLHEKTDPNVAKELSGIFMTATAKPNNQTKNETEKPVALKVKIDTTTKVPTSVKGSSKPVATPTDESKIKSKTKQKLGQREEAVGIEPAKPIAMAKKSIDWSDYFGIDRRRKKSLNNNIDDNWLLDQYLQAYARENLGKFSEPQEDNQDKEENYEMLMENLREAADEIINKAIKYTGAHEGLRNEQVIDKVREQVMNQLALAYDLENIRRILEEHKAEYTQEPANFYKGVFEAKKKRVTVKKEKATDPEISKMADENNHIENTEIPKPIINNGGGACSEVSSRITLCRKVISSNHSALIAPCVIHSFCSTCSKCSQCKDNPSERQCDVNFLELADNVCGESRPFCRYSARHVLPSMKTSYTGISQEPSPNSCDLDAVAKHLMECTQNGVML